MIYNYVVVGLATKDIIIINSTIKKCFGGTVTYASIQIKNLGGDPLVLSYTGERDYFEYVSFLNSFKINHLINKYKGKTLTFKNIYKGNLRFQNVYNYKFIPKISLKIPISGKCLHLGPILHELDFSKIIEVRNKFDFIAIDLQGMYRRVYKNKIRKRMWKSFKTLAKYFDIIKSGLDELYNVVKLEDFLLDIMKLNKVFILTLGGMGSLIIKGNEFYFIPSFKPRKVVDPTGAGDSYLATFLYYNCLLKYDIIDSALLASCASSFVVEDFGPNGIAGEKELIRRYKEQKRSAEIVNFVRIKTIINNTLAELFNSKGLGFS